MTSFGDIWNTVEIT